VWRFCGRAYLCSLLCVLGHLLLDWTNIYGMRMLLPFSSRWLRLDITDVIDPWILTLLLFFVGHRGWRS
jgi:inner membrane protein